MSYTFSFNFMSKDNYFVRLDNRESINFLSRRSLANLHEFFAWLVLKQQLNSYGIAVKNIRQWLNGWSSDFEWS